MEVLERINELTLKSDENGAEKSRAIKATLNAELRRAKAALLEDQVAKLDKLVRKGKSVTQETVASRQALVHEVRKAVEGIPDGVHSPRKPFRAAGPGTSLGGGKQPVTIDAEKRDHRMDKNPEYYQHSEASLQFQKDFEAAKARQDKSLDTIDQGLTTLRGIGEAMGETLRQQDVVLDAIHERMDEVTGQLKTNNMKLKGMVTKMRSTRNFCLDVVLICIILGLVLYLVAMFKK
ncbi:hypothetical protein WJX81_001822 [Elliptochloris bilobata]